MHTEDLVPFVRRVVEFTTSHVVGGREFTVHVRVARDGTGPTSKIVGITLRIEGADAHATAVVRQMQSSLAQKTIGLNTAAFVAIFKSMCGIVEQYLTHVYPDGSICQAYLQLVVDVTMNVPHLAFERRHHQIVDSNSSAQA